MLTTLGQFKDGLSTTGVVAVVRIKKDYKTSILWTDGCMSNKLAILIKLIGKTSRTLLSTDLLGLGLFTSPPLFC